MSEPDLRARAAAMHVVVIGGGIAGLVAARECAKVGIRVTVLEAAETAGGTIRRAELGDLTVDAGAECFSTRSLAVTELIEELGLGDRVESSLREGAWVSGIPGTGAAPLPEEHVAGIPVNPFDERVLRIIGGRGAWRAYLDRLRPPLTIGHETSLGRLVRSRMGARVRDRLVLPRSAGVWLSHPDEIGTDAVAPGLNSALTRTGSLTGAVSALVAQRTPSRLATLRGGLFRLVDALLDDLAAAGVEVRPSTPALRVDRVERGWHVEIEGEALVADAVVVATDERAARELLGSLLPDTGALCVDLELVILRVACPQLDPGPRDAEVFPLESGAVSAVGHATARWAWLADAASGTHLLRVSFARRDAAPATVTLSDAEAAALAAEEARAMLGVAELIVLDAHRERFSQALPGAHLRATADRDSVREALASQPGLAVAGAWLAGSGLAAVIPDAAAAAERLRRHLLWGGSTPGGD